MMFATILAMHVVIISGIIAGVMASVSRAVVPTFAALPADRYVQLLKLLDSRFDPFMPWLTRFNLLQGVVMVIVVEPLPAKILAAVGMLLLAGMAAVSEFGNVPINRQVLSWDPEQPPSGWAELRSRWARWQHLRNFLAAASFGAVTFSALLMSV
jgi:uncharacterized membrane protein